MEYKFVRTSTGPVVLGDDEVLYFSDYAQLFDYMDADPEFADKAIKFCEDAVRDYANLLIESLSSPVLDGDFPRKIGMYYQAGVAIKDFKGRYHATASQGFPGPNPQF